MSAIEIRDLFALFLFILLSLNLFFVFYYKKKKKFFWCCYTTFIYFNFGFYDLLRS